MRSVPDTIAYFAGHANWEFMREVRPIIGVLADLQGQSRCGLRCDFPSSLRATLAEDSPEVIANDSAALLLWRLVVNLLAQRSGSMSWHDCSYPGLWAGMLLNDCEAQDFLDVFRQDWEIYSSAKAVNLPSVQEIASRHSGIKHSIGPGTWVAIAAGPNIAPCFRQLYSIPRGCVCV